MNDPQDSSKTDPPDSFLIEIVRLIDALTAGGPIPRDGSVRRIGKYELGEFLGSGGYGVVHRAFDTVARRLVALKIPRPEILTCPRKRGRFVREAAVLARLRHRNVVGFHDADDLGGVCYIATEFCDFGSLADLLRNLPEGQNVPVAWAVDVVRQAALGMQHAHKRGVLHRDLKPGNLLLTRVQPHEPDTDLEEGAETEAESDHEENPCPDPGGGDPRFPKARVKIADF
ncbi:MAG: serine/threonine-protein kinase, partial [Isosphaeraceae bacterium]